MSGPSRIALLGTGGTIAMTAKGAGGNLTLDAAALSASLGDALAGIALVTRDVLAKPSSGFMLGDLGKIAAAVAEAVKDADGVVITHGTDTLEETAFALALLLRTDKPVVLTAAMRRPDQPGADGPANLGAAIRVAASPAARGLGVLVVMDDEIHAGGWCARRTAFARMRSPPCPSGPSAGSPRAACASRWRRVFVLPRSPTRAASLWCRSSRAATDWSRAWSRRSRRYRTASSSP